VPRSNVRLLPAGELAPAPRPALRLPGGDFWLPSPFAYLPPGYERLTLIYDTLAIQDPTGAVVPWLASAYTPTPDGLTHTFRLRDGVRWQDGQPFTADDVVFSFQYFSSQRAQNHVAPTVLFGPDEVTSVRATGPRDIEIRLDKPLVTFAVDVVSKFPIVPRHVWEPVPIAAAVSDLGRLIGTGPYRLESYVAGQGSYLFTANDDFFLGRPFVRRLELVPVGNQLLALRANQIDAGGFQLEATRSGALDPFRDDPAFGVVEDQLDAVVALYWNLTKGGALGDVRFRRACALAIDRDDLVARLLGGNGRPGNPGFLPPDHPFHVDVNQYRFDPGAAERLLDDAGYRRQGGGARRGPDGKPLRFKLSVPVSLAAPAELVKRALSRVGVEVNFDPMDSEFALSDYEMAMMFYAGVGGDADYMRVYESHQGPGRFQAVKGYSNPEMDDLLERQRVTLDETQRRQMFARAQQIAATDIPLLHLYYPVPFHIFRKAAFDQWPPRRNGGNNLKYPLVTGTGTPGSQIRPTRP
jgi:peptide/nickel transport system substrate-binding protein